MKLEIKNLSKKFKDVYVLKDINLTFESGKIYGFTGRNGSGKSDLGNWSPSNLAKTKRRSQNLVVQ